MNQKQRELLNDMIAGNVRARIDDLRKRLMKRPSLNNYLVHAILSGEIVYQKPEVLAEHVKERTIGLSGDEKIVSDKHAFNDGNRVKGDNFTNGVLLLPVEKIFVLPQAYLDRIDEVESYNEKVYQAIDALKAYGEKLKLKIMIGSDKALESLIDEADQLQNISLMKNIIGEMPTLSLSGKAKNLLLNSGGEINL